ncbi:hypothetical protein [Erwinia sp. PsM31]|uniref:hypothetical protein n=1 Tax=Erwinia sp. PsM31 TaxID=3030535 RepID=UPI00263A89E4|nr:hypothetical protein [Erwinia sp. PsM31]MDN4625793.1 hypothetical protein [Erwinia sp. PsM31]
MNKILPLFALGFSFCSSAAVDPGPGTYVCDIRITSSRTETLVLPEAALVQDHGSDYQVKMLGNEVASPKLASVLGGVKQQATVNGVTFFRRAKYDDRFIIENTNTGFFYRLRHCKKM